MSLLTYLNPDAIEDASIEGIKLKDGSISASKIDGTVASKSYVDDTITSAINTKANVDDVYTKSEVDDIASRNKGLVTELATAGDGYNVKLDWSLDPAKNGTIDPAYRGQVNLGANCTTSNTHAVATAPIRPLAWEPPYATRAAQEMEQRQKKSGKTKKKRRKKAGKAREKATGRA